MPRFGIVFPTASTIQEELEFGLVTNIEENIYVENTVFGPTVVGKAKGVYVAMSSSSDNNHMMAMTVSFSVENGDDDDKSSDEIDSLKFFGVHLRDVLECHVAVIGGTGKFNDANGYAVIKVVNNRDIGSTDIIHGSSDDVKLMLMYNVFLS
ncbi:dirigent protein 24-like [Chenopodium quinoa]|uniref:Dirigent protein n=1 Tax=Chenopodium quinoa TaxID=63459 RepID=A0A803M2T7_CHEQI|nr:dirigent protein 24-like [Chenopodium quinoa]